LPLIDRVMARAERTPKDLDAIAAAVGPGGFTGIRVGLAAAHGIALATGSRLIGVTIFAAAVARIREAHGAVLLVALESRREDLYVQLLAPDLKTALAAPAAVLPGDLTCYVSRHVTTASLLIAGDAAEAAAAALAPCAGCAIVANTAPDACGVAVAALRDLRSAVAAPMRPLYLRPPDVTVRKSGS